MATDLLGRTREVRGDENARRNAFPAERFRPIEGDIASFTPERRYDVILANPPFVPTPEGIEGTITSNGGADGNRFVEILLRRLDLLLEPSGEALLYVLQIVRTGTPLLVDLALRVLGRRRVELTPSQRRPTGFDAYHRAYCGQFPGQRAAIDRWRASLFERHGRDLAVCHYVVRVGPEGREPTSCVVRSDFAEQFGEAFLIPSDRDDELALARVRENVVG